MLEKLTIRNFQKHKKLEIEFGQHITCITGASDRGKSTIIRSLKWICTNRPSGNAFIRHSDKHAMVSLRVDGRTVTRTKGHDSNAYSLDKQEYHALGQGGVPEEIQQLLNINPALNFQNQMDAPFWFMLTPGEVSKQINQIINLELIDKTLANIASQLRKVKSQVAVCEERLEETKQRVSELAWAKEADEQLQEIELLYKQIQDKTRYVDSCRELVTETSRLRSERDRLGEAKQSGKELVAVAEKLLKKQERLEELKELVETIKDQRGKLDKTKEELNRLHKQIEEGMEGRCPLCKQEWDSD